MSPRPRTASNDDIVDGVMRAVARLGPARLALTDVAEETGLAPATLIQRFGSKQGMLRAALERAAGDAGRRQREVRAGQPSLVAALVAAAGAAAHQQSSPVAAANLLAFLQGEPDDPVMYRLVLDRSRDMVAGYRELIAEAVAAGELAGAEPGQLARTVHAAASGSLALWAVHRDGPASRWVQEDVEAVLAPYRRGQGTGAAIAVSPAGPAASGPAPAGPRARHRL